VEGGVPGDRVLVSVERTRRRFVEARVEKRVEESRDRRIPPCSVQPRCGGCPWMVLDEAGQREWKRRIVQEALQRIGGFPEPGVEEVLPSPRALGYRNKVELTLGRDAAGKPAIGYHVNEGEGHGPSLLDVERCEVQGETANAVLAGARGFLLERADSWADTPDGADPYRLILRRSELTGEMLVALRETNRPFPDVEAFASHLRKEHPTVAGVVRLRAVSGRRGGTRNVPVGGRPWIEERLGRIKFRLPASSFLQVNTEMAAIMLEVIAEHAGAVDGARVIDLYGGVGALGLSLADLGAAVKICEADGEAVRCGRRTAHHHGLTRATFVQADVQHFLRVERKEGRKADLIVANPPRTGLGKGVAEGIRALEPAKVVLVSCDPATLARDARDLAEKGFQPSRITPLDMFPQTAHVETVLTLTR